MAHICNMREDPTGKASPSTSVHSQTDDATDDEKRAKELLGYIRIGYDSYQHLLFKMEVEFESKRINNWDVLRGDAIMAARGIQAKRRELREVSALCDAEMRSRISNCLFETMHVMVHAKQDMP